MDTEQYKMVNSAYKWLCDSDQGQATIVDSLWEYHEYKHHPVCIECPQHGLGAQRPFQEAEAVHNWSQFICLIAGVQCKWIRGKGRKNGSHINEV